MKFNNRFYVILFFVLFNVIFCFSDIVDYRELIKGYIEKEDLSSAKRYLYFLKNSVDEMTPSDLNLEMQVNEKTLRLEDYRYYLEESYEKFGYEFFLREIINISSDQYFKYDEFKYILTRFVNNFPENFTKENLKAIVFYKKGGVDFLEANRLRLHLMEYLRKFNTDYNEKAYNLYSFLMLFELERVDEGLKFLNNHKDISWSQEVKWYIDYLYNYNNIADIKEFKDEFFKILYFFCNIYFEDENELIEEFENLEITEEKFYKNFMLAVMYESLFNKEKALFYYLKADSLKEDQDKILLTRIEDSIERLKLESDNNFIEKMVLDHIAREEIEKAYILADGLNEEKKIFYRARILYYYYNNYEKALAILEKYKGNSDDIKYLKAEILLKCYEYEKAEKICFDLIENSKSVYFNSSMMNLTDIYIFQNDSIKLEKFLASSLEKYGSIHVMGELFLKYIDYLSTNTEMEKLTKIIDFVLLNFSDNKEIFNRCMNIMDNARDKSKMKNLRKKYSENISLIKRYKSTSSYSKYRLNEKPDRKDPETMKREYMKSRNSGRRNRRRNNPESTNVIDVDDEIIDLDIKETEEIEIVSDTAEIQNVDTEEVRDTSENSYSPPSKEDYETALNELQTLAYEYFEICERVEDIPTLRDFAEKTLKDADEFDLIGLKGLSIINIAQAAWLEYKDIDAIVKYFYGNIKKYNNSSMLKDVDPKERAGALIDYFSLFYTEVAKFFVDKGFVKQAIDLCDNFYDEVDMDYKNMEVLKLRAELSVRLGELDTYSLNRLARDDNTFVDDFICENEFFDDDRLKDIRNYKNLEKTNELLKEFKELTEIKGKYGFFIRNNLNKHISQNYFDIISAFKDSEEVFINCIKALDEKKDYTSMLDVIEISYSTFNKNIIDQKYLLNALRFALVEFQGEKLMSVFRELSPIDDSIFRELDFSGYKMDFFKKLLVDNKDSEFVRDTILDFYLEAGNSSDIMELLNIYPKMAYKVFKYYAAVCDYELLEFYYNKFNNMADSKINNLIIIYRKYMVYKNKLNRALLSDYLLLNDIIDLCVDLSLFDEAINYCEVYKKLSGKEYKTSIETLRAYKEIDKIIRSYDISEYKDYLIGKYYYICEKYGIKPDEKFAGNENATEFALNIKETIEEFEGLLVEDTGEIVLDIDGSDTESEGTVEVFTKADFDKNLEDKNYKKAISIGEILSEEDKNLYFELAKLYEGTKDYDKAREAYREFILFDFDNEKSPEAQYKIGLLYLKQNKLPEAENNFERLIRYYPEEEIYNPKAEFKISQIIDGKIKSEDDEFYSFDSDNQYNEVDRFKDISDDIDEIKEEIMKTQETAQLARLYHKLGNIYKDKFKDFDKALDAYKNSYENNREDGGVVESMALCNIELREYQNAITNYEEYLSTLIDNEERAEIAFKIIEIYYQNLNKYSEALEKINVYVDEYYNTKGYYKALFYKGSIYENQYRDYQKAITEYTVLITEFQSEYAAKAQFQIGYIYQIYLKDYTQAKTNYDKVINEHSDFDLKIKAEDAIREMEENGQI